MSRQTALVVCPGRGSYSAAELGYLHRHHAANSDLLSTVDAERARNGQPPITELDRLETFKSSTHLTGDNASLLIAACAIGDFSAIDRERYDIVAVTGNSMGWYLALTCAGALSLENGSQLVNTMGTLMHAEGVGGQIIYPLVTDNWTPDETAINAVHDALNEAAGRDDLHASISIWLGGMIVLAGDRAGLRFLRETLPPRDAYPLALAHHAAFHSSLLQHCAKAARGKLSRDLFTRPALPMIDGQGQVWSPHATDLSALYDYTLGHQITETYDFSKAIEVAAKEFAPDRIIVLGPGASMGAPTAQALIEQNWFGLSSKADFKARQAVDPVILSMGLEDQRQRVVRA